MLEGSAKSNDLFNLCDVCVTVVNSVSHSSDGGEDGLICDDVVSELDGVLGMAKWWWCLNGGMRTQNWWYVFLIRVVELVRSGLVWVRELCHRH